MSAVAMTDYIFYTSEKRWEFYLSLFVSKILEAKNFSSFKTGGMARFPEQSSEQELRVKKEVQVKLVWVTVFYDTRVTVVYWNT